ncbi:MAG: sensor histidine kinase, partial [Clostridia bacterium]
IGLPDATERCHGNGLRGMKERLEFVNGSMELVSNQGLTVIIKVPYMFNQPDKEAGA